MSGGQRRTVSGANKMWAGEGSLLLEDQQWKRGRHKIDSQLRFRIALAIDSRRAIRLGVRACHQHGNRRCNCVDEGAPPCLYNPGYRKVVDANGHLLGWEGENGKTAESGCLLGENERYSQLKYLTWRMGNWPTLFGSAEYLASRSVRWCFLNHSSDPFTRSCAVVLLSIMEHSFPFEVSTFTLSFSLHAKHLLSQSRSAMQRCMCTREFKERKTKFYLNYLEGLFPSSSSPVTPDQESGDIDQYSLHSGDCEEFTQLRHDVHSVIY